MRQSKEQILKSIIDCFGDIGREALDSIREAVDSIIEEEVMHALDDERNNEIKRATAALYEAKVEGEVIIQLLQDYWKINKYQAEEALRVEKTVESPIMVLKTYLKNKGYKNIDIFKFLRENFVRQQLENDPSLWELSNSPEKLKKHVEENNKHIV